MSRHITVLEHEAVEALGITENSIVVDATANGGGHSKKIREKLGAGGLLISMDIDEHAYAVLGDIASASGAPMRVANINFRTIEATLKKEGVPEVTAILADLGWSTNQFEKGARGFSFKHDEPLLMTYGASENYPFTARDILNRWDEEDIANVLYGYADERRSRKIAHAIVLARKEKPFVTSGDLARVVQSVSPKSSRIHPATKAFQALRIAVNDEYRALADFLAGSLASLAHGGRLAIITFHSGEDRIVKETFRTWAKKEKVRLLTKKPQVPTRAEVLSNPRARSAKLRIIEKI